jgi:TRAP-type C4-dicarboxylate transport system permease small subunit
MTLFRGLDSVLQPARKVVYVAVVSMFALQVVVVFAQVIWRFVFNDPFSWSEELARYLQVWIILLASSVCIHEGSHLAVDYLVHYLPFRHRKNLALLVTVLMMVFVSVLIVAGIKMILTARAQASPALNVPVGAIYLVFPVAGTLMLLESLNVFLKTLPAHNKADLESVHGAGVVGKSTS